MKMSDALLRMLEQDKCGWILNNAKNDQRYKKMQMRKQIVEEREEEEEDVEEEKEEEEEEE